MNTQYINALMEQAWEGYQRSSDGNLEYDYKQFCKNWLKENDSEDLIDVFFPEIKHEKESHLDFVKKIVALDFLTPDEKMETICLRAKSHTLKIVKTGGKYDLIKISVDGKVFELK